MTDDQSQRAPYPGLRAFRRDETDLFFGREDCINAMVDRLAATRFLAVLGSSGTGKSSLVKTGLLDALELGLMASAGSRWRIAEFRPGGAPLRHLARSLLEAEREDEGTQFPDQDVDLLRAFLARGPRSIIEWCAGHLPKGTNLLLLVDQFEELFRYQSYAGREEAEAFVTLLLESAREAGVAIYVTITMRSEYLGACSLIEGLSDAINAGLFLTPRMTREQCREAIVGPAEVCNFEIEPALVNRLLNDLADFAAWDGRDDNDQLDRITRRADQLPLLQYTLNRMWLRARERSGDRRITLTVADYAAIGGLRGALDAHANQIFADLGRPRWKVIEWVFRSLTGGTTVADAVRRPTRFDELVAVCGGDEAAVRAVVDAFRAPGVNFLVPEIDPRHPALKPGDYIDISHESLIRQWKKLSGWLEAEARAAQQWRRLNDRLGGDETLSRRELANVVAWRRDTNPNETWAQRYGGNYAAVSALIRRSTDARRISRLAIGAAAVLFIGLAVHSVVNTYQLAEQDRAGRAKAESMLAVNERQRQRTINLLETMIWDVPVQVTQSPRSLQTTAARRSTEGAEGGAPRDRRGDDRAQTSADDSAPAADPQPTTDRAAERGPQDRPNPALLTMSYVVNTIRELVDETPKDTQLQRLLAVALNKLGDIRLEMNDLPGAEAAFKEGLEIVRTMVLVDPNKVLWQDDLALAYAGVAQIHMRRSENNEARALFQEAVGIERKLDDGDVDDRLLKNLQVHLGYLGDILIRLIERREARAIFEERLRIRRRRHEAARDDADLLADLSVALDRVGQLLRDEGDTTRSREHFEEALGIDRGLNKRFPDRREWQENLVLSLMRIGDLDGQVGQLEAALKHYDDALPLQRNLVATSDAVGPQQTLASLLGKIGHIKRRLKDFSGAQLAYEEQIALRRKLQARDTGRNALQDLAAALDGLGHTLYDSGDLAGARPAFEEQLKIDRSLEDRERGNSDRMNDLAWSLNRLGDLERDLKRFEEAAKLYAEALLIQQRLMARTPDSVTRMRALATALDKLGNIRVRLRQHEAARISYEQLVGLRRKLLKLAPSDIQAKRDLAFALDHFGNALRDTEDREGARKAFEEELSIDRAIYQDDPDDMRVMIDLTWTLNKVAEFLQQGRELQAARPLVEEMTAIERRLLEREPQSKARHRKLLDALSKLASLLVDMEDFAAAKKTYGELYRADERWLAVARTAFQEAESVDNRADLVKAYGDAGWHGLLSGEWKAPSQYMEQALALDREPQKPAWIRVNLGHAYLFLGRYADAKTIYLDVKDEKRPEDGKRTYADEIRDDFVLLRKLGLGIPEMDRMVRELKL